MLHVIDLRSDDQEIVSIRENVFIPFATYILQHKLYQDRTVKTGIESVANASISEKAIMISEYLMPVNYLNELNDSQKATIFTYWFQTQIESKIFILDPKHQYLAYNGKSSKIKSIAIPNIKHSYGFFRFDEQLKIKIEDILEIIDYQTFVDESKF